MEVPIQLFDMIEKIAQIYLLQNIQLSKLGIGLQT